MTSSPALHTAVGAVDPPVVRRAVAVLVSRFPTVTETFIQHEIDEMERQGQPVRLVPLLRDAPPVVHPQAQAWIGRALFTPLVSPGILTANARVMARRPLRYGALLARLIAGTVARPRVLLRTLALFPKSVYLAQELRAEGVRHVHAHFATYPATTALIIASLTDITFSFTAHAHDIFVDRALLRPKIARARFIRVISQFNAEFLASRYPRETRGKLARIHMGVPIPPLDRLAHRRSTGTPRLLCVAALKPYKGVHTLVEACRQLHATGLRFRCAVAGEGPERRRLARQIARAGLGDVVHLLGACSQGDIATLLRGASVFVLPSVVARNGQMEGIPVALMEAMAAGLPVAAPSLSGIPELVEDGVSGLLFEPGNTAALANVLRRLIDDAELRDRLAARGRRGVAAAFRLDRTVAHLVAELDRHNPGPPPEAQRVLAGAGPFTAGDVGCRRIRETRDSLVVEVVARDNGLPHERVAKVARSFAGESAAPTERARREFAALVHLERVLASGEGSSAAGDAVVRRLGVPRPLALDAPRGVIWLERCGGRRLDHLIRGARFRRDRARWAALRERVRYTGLWLRRFQDRTAEPLEPGVALSEVVANAAAALEASGLSRRARNRARDRLVHHAAQLPNEALRVVGRHGDFWPGNVFVADGSVEVIDFEGMGSGLPCEDVGWFLVTLNLLLPLGLLRRRRADLTRAFLGGYLDDPSALHPAALGLGLCAAAALLMVRVDPSIARWHRCLRRIVAEA